MKFIVFVKTKEPKKEIRTKSKHWFYGNRRKQSLEDPHRAVENRIKIKATPDLEKPTEDYPRKGRENGQARRTKKDHRRETTTMKNREGGRRREEVSDPHGNRIKTLGKRNFSCGKGPEGGVQRGRRGRAWFGSFGAFGNPPKKSRNGIRRVVASRGETATTTCHASRSISAYCTAG